MNAYPLRLSVAPRKWLALAVGSLCAAALYFGHGRAFVSLAYDPHEATCLPELHLVLLVHRQPAAIERGDYLFWKTNAIPALAFLKEPFTLKRVAGLPGDMLSIRAGRVYINEKLVVEGLEDAVLYKRRPEDFERREVIPPGHYFMVGTARFSNDSRYWGYLPADLIAGKAYRVY
jgi:conjugal transfer pilin signal peptidase TrbI